MKTLIASAAIVLAANAASAGILDTFEAPPEPVADEAPMGGSNAAWIIPLIAIVAIAAAASSDDNGGGDEEKVPPPVDE